MHSVSLCQFGMFGGNQSCCLLPAATTCTKHAQTYRMHAEINSRTMLLVFFCMFVCWLLSWFVFCMLTPQLLHPQCTVTSSSQNCSHCNTMHMQLLNFVIFICIPLCCYMHYLQWRRNLLWMLRLFWARHWDK